jgi:hypothetical protein
MRERAPQRACARGYAVDMQTFDLHVRLALPPLHSLATMWIRERWRDTDAEEM